MRWRMERAQLEQNIRDSKERMEKLEGYWMEAQSLCKVRLSGNIKKAEWKKCLICHYLAAPFPNKLVTSQKLVVYID